MTSETYLRTFLVNVPLIFRDCGVISCHRSTDFEICLLLHRKRIQVFFGKIQSNVTKLSLVE